MLSTSRLGAIRPFEVWRSTLSGKRRCNILQSLKVMQHITRAQNWERETRRHMRAVSSVIGNNMSEIMSLLEYLDSVKHMWMKIASFTSVVKSRMRAWLQTVRWSNDSVRTEYFCQRVREHQDKFGFAHYCEASTLTGRRCRNITKTKFCACHTKRQWAVTQSLMQNTPACKELCTLISDFAR